MSHETPNVYLCTPNPYKRTSFMNTRLHQKMGSRWERYPTRGRKEGAKFCQFLDCASLLPAGSTSAALYVSGSVAGLCIMEAKF